jgi:hypothetical protein
MPKRKQNNKSFTFLVAKKKITFPLHPSPIMSDLTNECCGSELSDCCSLIFKFLIAIGSEVFSILVCASAIVENDKILQTALKIYLCVLFAILLLMECWHCYVAISLACDIDLRAITARKSLKLTSTVYYSVFGICLAWANPVINSRFPFNDMPEIVFAMVRDVLVLLWITLHSLFIQSLQRESIACIVFASLDFCRNLSQISELNQRRIAIYKAAQKKVLQHAEEEEEALPLAQPNKKQQQQPPPYAGAA